MKVTSRGHVHLRREEIDNIYIGALCLYTASTLFERSVLLSLSTLKVGFLYSLVVFALLGLIKDVFFTGNLNQHKSKQNDLMKRNGIDVCMATICV